MKNTNYTIEKARPEDQTAIKSLIREARLDITDIRWQKFLVARIEKSPRTVLGCIQMKIYPGLKELASLVVGPAYRGQGIGQALVHRLLNDHLMTPRQDHNHNNRDHSIYLLCPQYRQSFYEQFHFKPVSLADHLPWLLVLRYLPARLLGPLLFKIQIIAMCWDKDSYLSQHTKSALTEH